MSRIIPSIIGLFLLAGLLALPAAALAQECTCFCGDDSSGATDPQTAGAASDCREYCEGQDPPLEYIGCYAATQTDRWPENDSRCWTQEDCENDIVTLYNGEEKPSIWGGQTAECEDDKGFCYNPGNPISLSVAVGSLSEAESIGQYIEAAYGWLIGAAAVIAIIVLMVGGLQYMASRGSESIGKAKERIIGAITGLILVLGAATIAALMDPGLVMFEELKVPKVRTVTFLSPDSTCEVMHDDAGIDISPPTGICGDKAVVTGLDNVKEEYGQVSIEKEEDCVFSKCEEDDEICVGSAASEKGYECVSCADSGSVDGFKPSESTCSQLISSSLESTADALASKAYCEFVSTSWTDFSADGCAAIVYPKGHNVLDCAMLRDDARTGGSLSCRAYDLAYAYVEGQVDNQVDDIEGENGVFPLLQGICEDDPCGLAPSGSGCKLSVVDDTSIDVGALDWLAPVLTLAKLAAADEFIVNCADSGAEYYGLWNCTGDDGKPTDCNPSW